MSAYYVSILYFSFNKVLRYQEGFLEKKEVKSENHQEWSTKENSYTVYDG